MEQETMAGMVAELDVAMGLFVIKNVKNIVEGRLFVLFLSWQMVVQNLSIPTRNVFVIAKVQGQVQFSSAPPSLPLHSSFVLFPLSVM